MEDKTVKNLDKKEVVVKWNGLAPFTLAYKGKQNRTIYPNQTIRLNLLDKQDLRHVLEVLKLMNSRANEQVKVVQTKQGTVHQELYYKWEIVEGKELIPEKLQKINYAVNDNFDDEIAEMVKTFVPKYFEPDIPKVVQIVQKR